jgi:hypothetical protein
LETRTSITRQQNQGFKATIEKENEETGWKKVMIAKQFCNNQKQCKSSHQLG